MNHKVIIIEGIPGSGKTTFSNLIYHHLKDSNIKANLYNEGDLHPIDLAWCSIINEKDFEYLLNKYSKYSKDIKKYSKKLDNDIITAYTKVRVDNSDIQFYRDFEKYEIYRTDDLNIFKDAHLKLWKHLKKTEDVYIFECIYLQNHINELILKHNLSKENILKYMKELINTIKDFNPIVFYLKPKNIEKTIKNIADLRRSDNPLYKDWIDLVIEYFENTKYGKKLGYIGYEGALKFFKDRVIIEEKVLKSISVKNHILNIDNNYNEVLKEIIKLLEKDER